MPNPLSQEQLAQLYAQFQQGNYGLNDQGYAPMGVVHAGEDAGQPSQLLGYTGNFSGLTPGSTYDLYGTNGQFSGTRKVEDGGSTADLLKSSLSDLGPAIAMVAAGYGIGSLLNGGFLPMGASGGAGGASGAASSAAGGFQPTAFGAVDPAYVPAGTNWIGGPMGAAAGGAAGAATGSSAGGASAGGIPNTATMGASGASGAAPGAFNAAMDSQAANAAIDAAGGNALSGYTAAGIPSVTVNGVPTSSLLDSLKSALPSGIGNYIAPIVGGLLGSKGVQSQQSSTRDVPEWLKPYIGKQLGYAGSLLDHQMSPEYQQASDQIRTGALGMLAPQQQSNFARFFPNAGMGQMNTNRPLGLLSY